MNRLVRFQPEAGIAAGGVDRDVGGLPEAGDAGSVLVPLGQPVAPQVGHEAGLLVRRAPGAGGLALVHPGAEVRGRQLRKGEGQVAEVALVWLPVD